MASSEQRGSAASVVNSPSARFTAVNSSSDSPQNVSCSVTGNGVAQKRKLDEKTISQPKTPSPAQEKSNMSTTSSSNQQEDQVSSVNDKKNAYSLLKNSILNVSVDLSSKMSHKSGTEEVHKRRRSNSTGQGSFHHYPLPPPTLNFIPDTSIADSDLAQEENLRQQLQACPRETYTPPGAQFMHFRQSMNSNDERESAQDSEKWVIGELLHRVPHSIDARGQQHTNLPATSPSDDNLNQFSQGQGETKRRKRNFSNRTKTGCMTCRKRKKKCDETKPECNNCQRGGFVCSGYQVQGQWLKPDSKPCPVPLQSKTEYDNSPYSSTSPYLPSNIALKTAGSHQTEPPSTYRSQTLHQDRLIDGDESRLIAPNLTNNASQSSLENHHSIGSSYTLQQAQSPAGHPYVQQIPSPINNSYTQQTLSPVIATNSAYSDRHSKNQYERVHDGIFQETPRSEPEISIPQVVTANPPPHLLHTQEPGEGSPSSALYAQKAAQMALSNLASSKCSSHQPIEVKLAGPPTHKEHMLAGRDFSPFDKQLVLEREICTRACWRFNNSDNSSVPVSSEKKARLFREILQAHEHVVPLPQASPVNPVGRIGENVVVETPFYCDYGYNISIGQDVVISKNCTILDTCEVHIGDRCYLGPNVNIYTTTLPIDPKRRLGSKGPHLGQKIIIESDCWIGGSVIILPGRKIGKGATIGAGSVVTKDIPPYTVACGNPAKILRKIEHNDTIVMTSGNLSHILREDDDVKKKAYDDPAHSI